MGSFQCLFILKVSSGLPYDPDMAFGSNERTALSLTLGTHRPLHIVLQRETGGIKNRRICELFLLDKQKNETR